MADLPSDRLEPSPPFTFRAVDLFGPWYIKEGRTELKNMVSCFFVLHAERFMLKLQILSALILSSILCDASLQLEAQ